MFGANAAFTAAHIPRDWLAGLKVFYLGGLFLMPSFRTEEFLDLLKFCRTQGVTSVVDVVLPQHHCGMIELAPLLPFIDYFLPNEDEARTLTGCAEPLEQVRVLVEGGAGTVVVTCGKSGAVAGRNAERWRVAGFRMEAADPSGSGDAFSSGIVTGILHGWELPRTLVYASALGASAVQAVGTTAGVFTAAETEAFLATHTMDSG
jgi:sugar/nucleoside kinase (ribokinase family)